MPELKSGRVVCPKCHGDKWCKTICTMCNGKLTVEGCRRCDNTGLVSTPLAYGGVLQCPDCSGYGSTAAREVATRQAKHAPS